MWKGVVAPGDGKDAFKENHNLLLRTKCGSVDMMTTTITIKIGGDDGKDTFKENQNLLLKTKCGLVDITMTTITTKLGGGDAPHCV